MSSTLFSCIRDAPEKDRYTDLNAEFQRIAGRDKKAFLSDQCKEMRKTIEWERLEISSRKLEISRNISCKDGLDKGQKWYLHNTFVFLTR